jgi:hypothetical protein
MSEPIPGPEGHLPAGHRDARVRRGWSPPPPPGRVYTDPTWEERDAIRGLGPVPEAQGRVRPYHLGRVAAALDAWHSRPHTPDDDTTALVEAAQALVDDADRDAGQ